MANLLYLLGAVFASAVLSLVIWLRNRRPRSTEWAIDSFRRELQALAPDKHRAELERRNPG